MLTPFEPLAPSEHRLHPSSLLFNMADEVKQFAIPAAAVVFSADGWKGLLWGAGVLALGAVFAVGKYLTFRYRYGESELIIRSGLFFKQERHIPYSRIQNVDTRQNLLHRALGVQTVVLETASGGTPEAVINVLPDSAVAEMRQRVFAKPRAADAAAEVVEPPPPP
jgi:putative membrane protein